MLHDKELHQLAHEMSDQLDLIQKLIIDIFYI